LVVAGVCRMYLRALPGYSQPRLSPVNPFSTGQCCCAVKADTEHYYSPSCFIWSLSRFSGICATWPLVTETGVVVWTDLPMGVSVGSRRPHPVYHGSFRHREPVRISMLDRCRSSLLRNRKMLDGCPSSLRGGAVCSPGAARACSGATACLKSAACAHSHEVRSLLAFAMAAQRIVSLVRPLSASFFSRLHLTSSWYARVHPGKYVYIYIWADGYPNTPAFQHNTISPSLTLLVSALLSVVAHHEN